MKMYHGLARQPHVGPRTIACLLIVAMLGLTVFPVTPATADEMDGATEWPAIDDAQIRPGVQIVTEGSQCTSNFIFRDQVSSDLFIGLAAHCVDHVGQSSTIRGVNGGVAATGDVAYISFDHTDHDFGLVLIPESDEGLVHPAMLHFGGPTGLADTGQLVGGEKFLFYGNSGSRQGIEESNWHEGYVTITSEYESDGHAVTPGIPGDSGSGLLDAEGRALGVLVTVGVSASIASTNPLTWAGTNGFTNLDAAVSFAENETGMELELQTWDLLDAGLLPEQV